MRANVKRVFLISLATVLLFALVSCGGEETLPSVEEVVTNTVFALEELTTWRSDQSMNVDIDVSGPDGGRSTVSTSSKGTIDLGNRKVHVEKMETSMMKDDEETETRQTVYIIEDTVYMKSDTPTMEGRWMKQVLSDTDMATVWETLVSALSASKDMLEAIQFERISLADTHGVSCYLLEGSPDVEEWLRILQEIGPIQVLPPGVSDMLRDVKVAYWVNKDTYNLVQFKMTATISMVREGRKIKGDMNATSYYYDHGKEVSVELPPAARN